MRVNLAEARGKEQPSKRHSLANVSKTDQRNNNGNQNQGVHGKPPQDQRRSVVVDLKNKPPVPPTKESIKYCKNISEFNPNSPRFGIILPAKISCRFQNSLCDSG